MFSVTTETELFGWKCEHVLLFVAVIGNL